MDLNAVELIISSRNPYKFNTYPNMVNTHPNMASMYPNMASMIPYKDIYQTSVAIYSQLIRDLYG